MRPEARKSAGQGALRRLAQTAVGFVAFLALTGPALSRAAIPEVFCPDLKPAAGVDRAGNQPQCLTTRTFEVTGAGLQVLVVFLPDDSGGNGRSVGSVGSGKPLADNGTALQLSQKLGATTVEVQRQNFGPVPGWSDPFGTARNDDFTLEQVALFQAALVRLRARHSGKKILLIGHASGAAMAALLASRFPGSAEAYLLAACPCDVPAWRQWRNMPSHSTAGASPSLSPQAEVQRVTAGTRIGLVVGNRDDNTLPQFSEAYVARLQAQGVKTRLTYALGATHVSVQRSPELLMVARNLIAELSR